MKRVIAAFALCIITLGMAQSSSAQMVEIDQRVYFSGYLGINSVPDTQVNFPGFLPSTVGIDPGLSLGGAVGMDMRLIRLEAELGIRSNAVSTFDGFSASGSLGVFSIMGNGYFDLPTEGPFKPYIGMGLGLASVSATEVDVLGFPVVDDTASALAFQFALGMTIDVNPTSSIYFDYRYFKTGTLNMEDVVGFPLSFEYEAEEIRVGIRAYLN